MSNHTKLHITCYAFKSVTFPESLIIMFYFQDLENAVVEYFIKMHVSHPITSKFNYHDLINNGPYQTSIRA